VDSEGAPPTRTVTSLSLGARLSLLAGLVIAAFAVYLYFVPIEFVTPAGSAFRCGSAADPVSDTFGRNVCADRNKIQRYRAITVGSVALLVAVGGAAAFGLSRREERDGLVPVRETAPPA
jgi:hypothetical protein